jgi:hypothetical protein
MAGTGLRYSWPRTPPTRCWCETPMPSTKRPGASSDMVLWIARSVIGSRA